MELAVRSGGHSLAGHSVSEGGIVLDLSDLRALEIDAERRTAWAQTGLTAGEYTTAAGAHGLATGFGDTGSVGIGGLTLGGGVGFLVRKHGLTIDDLLAAELVTADGELLHVDAETHPDLFWAIRGGGGNFGVATRFQFRLHEVDTIVGGMLILPATPEVIASFVAEAEAAPEELSAIANIMVAPPMPFLPAEAHGKLVVMALMCYAGDVEAGERAFAPFRALAEPIADTGPADALPGDLPAVRGGGRPRSRPGGRTLVLRRRRRPRRGARRSSTTSRPRPRRWPWRSFACWVGRWRACPPRRPRSPTVSAGSWSRSARSTSDADETPAHEAWVTDFAAALRQDDAGVYVNFLGDEGEARVRDAYPGPTWDRLAAIKAPLRPDQPLPAQPEHPAGLRTGFRTKPVPSGRARRHAASSSVAPVASGYERSLRPSSALADRTRPAKRHSETSSSPTASGRRRPRRPEAAMLAVQQAPTDPEERKCRRRSCPSKGPL